MSPIIPMIDQFDSLILYYDVSDWSLSTEIDCQHMWPPLILADVGGYIQAKYAGTVNFRMERNGFYLQVLYLQMLPGFKNIPKSERPNAI